MEAIDAYRTYVALKNHFTSDSYDYFKYNKKTNVTFDSFQKRKDKIFFAKLGNRKDSYLEEFLVSNFIHDTKTWIGELLSEESEAKYKEWKRKQESLTYAFKNEIEFLDGYTKEQFDDLFRVEDGTHPRIILMYLQKEMSIETLIILDSIFTFMRRYDRMISDPLYKEVSKLCKKYQPFLKFDKSKMKSLVRDRVMS